MTTLTARQREVLFVVAELDGLQAAADELGIKLQSLKNIMGGIHASLECRSTTTALYIVLNGNKYEH